MMDDGPHRCGRKRHRGEAFPALVHVLVELEKNGRMAVLLYEE